MGMTNVLEYGKFYGAEPRVIAKTESSWFSNLKNEIAYLDREDEYSEEKKDTEDEEVSLTEFLSNIKEYSLDESLIDTPNKFHDFLNVVIPKTRLIFRLIRKYIKDKLKKGCHKQPFFSR